MSVKISMNVVFVYISNSIKRQKKSAYNFITIVYTEKYILHAGQTLK